jgi:hypothetical protein
MGDLRDELLKSGITDKGRARKIAHEEKSRRKKAGPDAAAQERAKTEAERRERDRARRQADRERELARQAEEDRRQESFRLAQLVRDHALTTGVAGPRRFHFVTREKRIPFLDVSEETARGLSGGQLAICEVPGTTPEEFVVVPATTAQKVRSSDPSVVLFLADARS